MEIESIIQSHKMLKVLIQRLIAFTEKMEIVI